MTGISSWLAHCVRFLLRYGCIVSLVFGLPIGVQAAPGDVPAAASADLPQGVPAVVTKAIERMAAAAATADAAERDRTLAEGQTALESFLRDNPTHRDTVRVEMQLGQLLVARGVALSADAAQTSDAAAAAATTETARQLLVDAERHFATAVDVYKTQLESFPTFLEPDSPDLRHRDQALSSYVEARMYYAAAVEQRAATYAAETADYRQLNQAAADRYELLYKEYRTLIAGLLARLKQGECYRNLGDTRRALGLYSDLLAQPEDLEPLRRLRVSAMYLSQECWMMEQEKLYELAFSQGEEFLLGQRADEQSWPEWQSVRFYTSQGYLMAAGGLPQNRGQDRAAWLEKAREHAEKLAATEGPYRDAAADLLKQIAAAAK